MVNGIFTKIERVMRILLCSLCTFIFLSCKTETKTMDKKSMENSLNQPAKDTTPKVLGIGGIFFFSENTDQLKNWYSKNLGIETNEWGASFESRNANNPDEVNYLQWSPFAKGSEYFSPSKKEFMINYRVQNIEGLVAKLKKNGVQILDSIATYDYGKFVHIMDEEGTKIELWEPLDKALTELEGETNK